MSRQKSDDDIIVIKKYANRRLYNTHSSSYITLDFIASLIKENKDFKVIDAKSGEDITRNILTQIIMDQESGEEQMLPTSFLRQLIGMYGNSLQAIMPSYLEASMDSLKDNQKKLTESMGGSLNNNLFAQIARQNMAMFEAASSAFKMQKRSSGSRYNNKAAPTSTPSTGSADEISDLKKQLADMQDQIAKMSKE
ncbi:polyhydroxyalkanoate synthesis repressor PhaR [Parasphingorhabdus sp. DH2-15]|uniref:polyhydroxyalkanoate synthesis repressor PhaR n=1 Tax=Parasphingorhabdus sp. DH2-15 TaxID=3444112 RepID=UPI003F687487